MMARSPLTMRAAPWAMTAVVAVAILTAGTASAQPLRPAGYGPAVSSPSCQAGQLAITVPDAIPGDPAEGMGKQAWNVLLRDTGRTACSLRGWPTIVFRGTADGTGLGATGKGATGTALAVTVSDVQFSNLAPVAAARIVLRPGQNAVVTAVSAVGQAQCASRWAMGLTLPGSDRQVTVSEPAGSFVPCVGGQLQLSPFYAEQALTSEIKALRVSSAPPPFAATDAAEPATCQASALRAQVTSTASATGGAVVQLRLGNSGRTCVLPESWPTVKVHSVGDAPRVAKIFADSSALQAERSLLTTYEHGTAQSTALTLRRGEAVSVALLAPRTGPQACQRLTSVTIYPSSLARGAGSTAHVTAPVSICGPPRILSFLPDRSTSADMTIARAALVAVRAGTAESGGDSTGFYYGTDSSAPAACGKGPYTEPVGSCSQGTAGPYGEYIGEVGSFLNWKSCTTAGLNWVQSNYNMANDNILDYGVGLGAAGYWFAAGPGRDPHYNGTTAEATTWGEEQAQQVIAGLGGYFFNFRYIFLDIENNGTPPDENGWNTVWNGPCGNTVQKSFIAPDVDFATYQGFVSYINQYTPYSAAVYSAGGNTYGSWSGIFGGQKLQNADEWTFTDEQTNLDRPAGFANSGSNARWFGGEPAVCHLLWQYSGGNGDLNGYGDFDQAEAANNDNPAC
ncbi:MAG: DUF4232 domain-containing protein [Streptosporangiaceae bacterium]